jgi:hypothetical protein
MRNAEIPFFQSFVGKDYVAGGIFGKRIMVLGESHYCEEDCQDCGDLAAHRECCAYTHGVVSDYLNEQKPRKPWMNTYLKFERSLVGHETFWPERHRIWQSLLFYNYLQMAMGGPRQAGTDAEYRQSEGAFFSVIDQYRPQYLIAWGSRLWGQMPAGERWQDGDDITIDGYTVYTGSYALAGGGRVKATYVNHPSVGYSWDYWHRVIATFLSE